MTNWFYFSLYFSQKIGFSGKNKKNISKCHQLLFLSTCLALYIIFFQDNIYYTFKEDSTDPFASAFFAVYRGTGEIYLKQPLTDRPQDFFRVCYSWGGIQPLPVWCFITQSLSLSFFHHLHMMNTIERDVHYENTPIQIYRKFHLQNWKFLDKKRWYFSYFWSKHRLWVLVRTASVRRF